MDKKMSLKNSKMNFSPLMDGSLFDDGRFKIIKHLGEGYCSHVYLAETLN